MNVKLISSTEPVNSNYLKTAEDLIAYCARVSNPSNQLNTETAPNLLRYLIKHKHWSPFEMVSLTFEIQTSRAIAAQILRHRSFSFQEFSQRYSEAGAIEDVEWRLQGKTNRQVGEDKVELEPSLQLAVQALRQESLNVYTKLLWSGIAKECARMVLPLSKSTTIYMSGTVRSWLSYLNIRLEQGTQKEHRDIAVAIAEIFIDIFPNITESVNKFNNLSGGFM